MDANLVARVQAYGDHQAFERLVNMHQLPIKRFLLRLTGGAHAISDEIAQETFLSAYLNISKFRNEGRFLSWLFTIAYRSFVNYQRKHSVNFENIDDVEIADPTIANNLERAQALDWALMQLSADERVAILLWYKQELTQEEISDVLGQPLGTVKTMLRRGKMKMKNLLNEGEQRREA